MVTVMNDTVTDDTLEALKETEGIRVKPELEMAPLSPELKIAVAVGVSTTTVAVGFEASGYSVKDIVVVPGYPIVTVVRGPVKGGSAESGVSTTVTKLPPELVGGKVIVLTTEPGLYPAVLSPLLAKNANGVLLRAEPDGDAFGEMMIPDELPKPIGVDLAPGDAIGGLGPPEAGGEGELCRTGVWISTVPVIVPDALVDGISVMIAVVDPEYPTVSVWVAVSRLGAAAGVATTMAAGLVPKAGRVTVVNAVPPPMKYSPDAGTEGIALGVGVIATGVVEAAGLKAGVERKDNVFAGLNGADGLG